MKKSQGSRHQARRFAVQALYQWQYTGNDLTDIINHIKEQRGYDKSDTEYFQELIEKITLKDKEIQDELKPYIDRDFDKIDPIEQAVLRIGTYELIHRPEIPHRVILNESIELTKRFGGEKGYRYVNGILDKLVQKHRAHEIATKTK